MPKRALLFVNRYSRQGQKRFAQAMDELHALDIELITVANKDVEQLTNLIYKLRDELDLVIVGGGDGTLNAVAAALVETQIPLGILPLGTANDLARTLDIPAAIPDACRAIATGQIQHIDLGWVNGNYFFNVASLGLSVKITQRLSRGLKRRWGALAYGIAALQAIWQIRPISAEIRMNGERIPVRTLQIAVGNGRYYGGGMAIAQDATIDDQRLDLYSLEIEKWWQLLPLLWTMRQGQQATLPWVRSLTGKDIEIHTYEPHTINTDGELTTHTPAHFRVIPQAIAVVIPS